LAGKLQAGEKFKIYGKAALGIVRRLAGDFEAELKRLAAIDLSLCPAGSWPDRQ